MADGDTYLGEFRRGPAIFTIFTVFALNGRRRIRVDCNDGNGPSDVCTLTLDDAPDSDSNDTTEWHGAWNGDEWCPWIEAETRKVIAR